MVWLDPSLSKGSAGCCKEEERKRDTAGEMSFPGMIPPSLHCCGRTGGQRDREGEFPSCSERSSSPLPPRKHLAEWNEGGSSEEGGKERVGEENEGREDGMGWDP